MRNLLLKGVAAGAIVAALAAVPAKAADLPMAPEPVYVPPPVVLTWTGFYVGVHGGAGWVDSDDDHDKDFIDHFFDDPNHWSDPDDMEEEVNSVWVFDDDLDNHDDDDDETTWLFGAQTGYNWQMGNFVVGLEADVSWTNFEREKRTDFVWTEYDVTDGEIQWEEPITGYGDGRTTFKVESDWLATLRARAGFAYDRWLIYVTGGAAVTSVDVSLRDRGDFFDDDGDLGANDESFSWDESFDDDSTLWGWTIGVGLEGMITPNLTAKIEYLYINFNEDDFENDFDLDEVDFDFGHGRRDSDIDAHVIRAGLNYKFNW